MMIHDDCILIRVTNFRSKLRVSGQNILCCYSNIGPISLSSLLDSCNYTQTRARPRTQKGLDFHK